MNTYNSAKLTSSVNTVQNALIVEQKISEMVKLTSGLKTSTFANFAIILEKRIKIAQFVWKTIIKKRKFQTNKKSQTKMKIYRFKEHKIA